MVWCIQTWVTVFFFCSMVSISSADSAGRCSRSFIPVLQQDWKNQPGTPSIIISSSNFFSNTPAVFSLRLLKQSVLRGWKESCANGSGWLSLTENAFWKEFCQPKKVALYCKFASDSRSRRSDKRASRLLAPRGSIWSVGCLLRNAEIYMSTSSTVQNNRW